VDDAIIEEMSLSVVIML